MLSHGTSNLGSFASLVKNVATELIKTKPQQPAQLIPQPKESVRDPGLKEQVTETVPGIAVKPIAKIKKPPMRAPGPIQKKELVLKETDIPETSIRVLQVGQPQLVTNQNMHKRFKINLIYTINNEKPKRKTIMFGNKLIDEYVDGITETKRAERVRRLTKTNNCLQPNWWVQKLLNNSPDIGANYAHILKKELNIL